MDAPKGLSLGCAFSDRIEALMDGRVKRREFQLDVSICQPQALFKDALTRKTYDLVEMSLGTHLAAVAAGNTHYVALPVFLSRAFRHSNIYVRTDAAVVTPSDLVGKRVGLIDYAQTAGVWVRGMLADEYGVDRDRIHWITGGLHEPALEDRMGLNIPSGIEITRTDKTLDGLLACGEIDAIISPQAPKCFRQGHPQIRRLFADPTSEESQYFKRTGIFPIMHSLIIRRSIVEDSPSIGSALLSAFSDAKDVAIAELAHRDYPKVSLPWIGSYQQDASSRLGGNVWTYGVDANRAALDAFLRYSIADGLCDADFDISKALIDPTIERTP
jgi:4,5-dihydroxyphthalate decarboxylase